MAIKFIGDDENGISFIKHFPEAEPIPGTKAHDYWRDQQSAKSFAGVTVTKDLACIVIVNLERGAYEIRDIHHQETVMVTFTDGRAFRSVPYFNRWRPEFVLHDDNLEVGALERTLADLCAKWSVQSIGYDPAQIPDGVRDRRAIAIAKDSLTALSALKKINLEAQRSDGGCHLYEKDSAKDYMWNSLPTERVIRTNHSCGEVVKYEVMERVFPRGELVARGRYDVVHALVNAVAAGMIAEHIPTDEQKEKVKQDHESRRRQIAEGQIKQIEEYWESLPPEAVVLIEPSWKPGSGMELRYPMKIALPLLKSKQMRFIKFTPEWQHLAWTGFKPINIVDENGVTIETVNFDR